MATTPTANLSLNKMDKGDLGWWSLWNSNADIIDALFPDASRPNKAIVYYNSSGQFAHDEAAFLWDATNDTLIIGQTSTSAKKLGIKRGSNADSTGQPTGNYAAIIYNATDVSNECGLLIKVNSGSSPALALDVGQDVVGGAFRRLFSVSGDRATRIPDGGSLSVGNVAPYTAGTINVENDILKDGTPYTNPDYVFEHFFSGRIERYSKNEGAEGYCGILSLEQIESFAKEHWHLPQVSREPAGAFARSDMSLLLHEEIFLHLFNFNKRLKAIESAIGKDG